MGVNSLPKTVTRQRRGCDLNPGPSAPESSTLTTRLPSHQDTKSAINRTVVDQPSTADSTCDGRPIVHHSTVIVKPSTARFRRTGPSATADTCFAFFKYAFPDSRDIHRPTQPCHKISTPLTSAAIGLSLVGWSRV